MGISDAAEAVAILGIAALVVYSGEKITKVLQAPAKSVVNQVSGQNAAVAIDTSLGVDTSGKAYQAWLAYHSATPVTNPVNGVVAPALPGAMLPLVAVGNAITPPGVPASAAVAGQQFSSELAANNDVARYNALDPITKGLVTSGQAIGSIFGFDLYGMGHGVS